MKLFLIGCEDPDLDAFVRTMTRDEALAYWRMHFNGRYEDDAELSIIEVPEHHGTPGVIPWDTLKIVDEEA